MALPVIMTFSLPPRMVASEVVCMTYKEDTKFSEIKKDILKYSQMTGNIRIMQHYMHPGAVDISDSETVMGSGGTEFDIVSDNDMILLFHGSRLNSSV